MSLKKLTISSMSAILDEVNDDELYLVIGGCGGSMGYSSTPTFPHAAWQVQGH